MKITFIGHATVPHGDRIKERVKEQLRASAANAGTVTCYLGGYGAFDRLCACACREWKAERAGIEIVYVTPYLSSSNGRRAQQAREREWYDASVYPPIERIPPKLAILKRNEWMITNADLVIAYIDHSFGGAYRSLQFAIRKKKKIIHIGDLF